MEIGHLVVEHQELVISMGNKWITLRSAFLIGRSMQIIELNLAFIANCLVAGGYQEISLEVEVGWYPLNHSKHSVGSDIGDISIICRIGRPSSRTGCRQCRTDPHKAVWPASWHRISMPWQISRRRLSINLNKRSSAISKTASDTCLQPWSKQLWPFTRYKYL